MTGLQISTRSARSCIVIAAGGDGSRMKGDKPGRSLAGQPMVHRMADWAGAQCDRIALALRTPDQVSGLDTPRLIDAHAGIGPISALASAFAFALAEGCDFVLLVGCDQPFLPVDLLARLADVIDDAGAAMPVYEGQDQPMATLWRAAPATLERYIADGGQSLWRFAGEVGAQRVEWGPRAGENPFFNVNDAAALAQAEARIRNAGR